MKKILVVEDDLVISKALESRLKSEGFHVALAADGDSALKEVDKEKPNLIVLDLMLPKQDGYTVCNQLKRDKNYCKIPIIIVTARDEQIDMELGNLVGADMYLTKPFDAQVLIAKINELLGETAR